MRHWSGRTETATENRVGQLGQRWAMSSLQKPFISGVVDSSRAVMRVLYTFCCNISHVLLSTWFKSGEFEGHDSAAGVGGSLSDSACFFLHSRHLTLYLINLCDMCDMRLWVIDLADELLNCCESAVMEFGGLCQERLVLWESNLLQTEMPPRSCVSPFQQNCWCCRCHWGHTELAVLLLVLFQVHHRRG